MSGAMLAGLVAAAIALPGAAGAERFTLFWWTVDGGGETVARSPRFLVAATIGQPDAGAADSAGDFALQSGFFSAGFPLPAYGILIDGFESGDTRRWSLRQPPG